MFNFMLLQYAALQSICDFFLNVFLFFNFYFYRGANCSQVTAIAHVVPQKSVVV